MSKKNKSKVKKKGKLLNTQQEEQENYNNPVFGKINFIAGCIVVLICSLVMVNLDNIKNIRTEKDKKNVEALWSDSQEKQNNNAYFLEAENRRFEKGMKTFKGYYKLYKTKNIWHVTHQEYIDENGSEKLCPDKSVAFYDGENVYSYADIQDYNHQYILAWDGIIYEDGKEFLEEDREYNPNTTLRDAINRRNYLNRLINWYDYDADPNHYCWNSNEEPKIIGRKKVNGLECIMIKFSDVRETCVSKDYGIALYNKQVFTHEYQKEPIITEEEVVNIKNTEKDGFKMDYSILTPPQDMYIRSREVFAQEPG